MIEKPSTLNLFIVDKKWEYVDFSMTVGTVQRRFACSSLLVFARTYLDPKYGSMPGEW